MTSRTSNASSSQFEGQPRQIGPSVQVACPTCEATTRRAIGAVSDADSEGNSTDLRWTCPTCEVQPPGGAAPPKTMGRVEKCWVCSCEEFYIQKDFNRSLGFAIVVGSFAVIFLVMLTKGHLIGIYLLFGLAFIDWVIYQLLPNVTVCYLCHSIYRGFPQSPDHKGFYLGSEEKYKPLRQAWIEKMEAAGE